MILIAIDRAGYPATDVSEITPTSLTVGYGRNVCVIISWLCDKVLLTEKFQLKRPNYLVTRSEYEEDIDPASN